MEEAREPSGSEKQHSLPETPEDVAILYSWANMPGAKYRDFSASRRQYRAQQRAQIAERQRQAELQAAKELEEAAQREFDEAERLRKESRRSYLNMPPDWDDQFRSRELVRRAEEHALRERQEAQRRQRSAESLGVQAQRARSEMLEARTRAEQQASRYAEAAASYHEEFNTEARLTIPGEVSDPYYYTGQVDPAYFAPTPGVRTAQATRVSSERRRYAPPVDPSSEEHEPGSLLAYRSDTNFAPSPSQVFRPARPVAAESPAIPEQPQPVVAPRMDVATEEPAYPANDAYYDGKPPGLQQAESAEKHVGSAGKHDVLIRPVARVPDRQVVESDEDRKEEAEQVIPAFRSPSPSVEKAFETEVPAPAVAASRMDASEPLSIEEREAFVDESDMFFDEERLEASFAAASQERRAYRPPLAPDPLPILPPVPAEPPPSVNQEQQPISPTKETLPEDARVRLSRHDLLPSVASQERSNVPRNPSWLEPRSEQAQIFLPPQMRQEAARVQPAPSRRSGKYGIRALPREPLPDVRPSARPLRYNRNIARGNKYASVLQDFDRRRASQSAPQSLAETEAPAQAPESLQQSRERVASQWFALKGLMEHGPESVEARQGLELRTPSLCVMSVSGGVGKTSIVAGLGRALSSMGEKVLLTDANPHGLLPYYFGARDLRPGMMRTFTPTGGKDAPVQLVKSLVGGLDRDEAAQQRAIAELGGRARGSHRVVLDLGSDAAWLARRLASAHPWVLVPVAPDTNSVVTTQAVERLFAGIVDGNGQTVMPYYVLNQYDPSLPLHLDVREVLRRSLGERLLRVTLRRSAAVAEALAQGMTVVDYAPYAPVTEDYMNLANWLRHISASGSGAVQGPHWGER